MTVTITKPVVGGSQDTWGTTLNTALDDIVAVLNGTTAMTPDLTSFDIGSVPVTATAAELNKLDGVTATTAEINYVDGVTSNIQTQLDSKQASDATLTALAGLATGANKIPYSTGTDTFGQLDFKDEDSMSSNSATAIPSQQSVKAYVDGLVSVNGATSDNWLKLGGLYVQWGTKASLTFGEATTFSITFPRAFPNGVFQVQTSLEINSGTSMDAFVAYVKSKSTTGANLQFASHWAGSFGTGSVHYIAIGY